MKKNQRDPKRPAEVQPTYNGPLHRPLPTSPLEDACFAGVPSWLFEAIRGPWKIPACDRTFTLGDEQGLIDLWVNMRNANPKAGPRLGAALMDAAVISNLMTGNQDRLTLPDCDSIVIEYARRFLWLPIPLSILGFAEPVNQLSARLLAVHNSAVLLHERAPEMRAKTLKGSLAQMQGAQDIFPGTLPVKANGDKPQEDVWYLRLPDKISFASHYDTKEG
jgi:hypothetical protein